MAEASKMESKILQRPISWPFRSTHWGYCLDLKLDNWIYIVARPCGVQKLLYNRAVIKLGPADNMGDFG